MAQMEMKRKGRCWIDSPVFLKFTLYRAAEKYAALWIDQFAQDLFTQFGARVCVLLSYQDSADTHNISTSILASLSPAHSIFPRYCRPK